MCMVVMDTEWEWLDPVVGVVWVIPWSFVNDSCFVFVCFAVCLPTLLEWVEHCHMASPDM